MAETLFPTPPTRRLSILDIIKYLDNSINFFNTQLKTAEPCQQGFIKLQIQTLETAKAWIYETYEKGVRL